MSGEQELQREAAETAADNEAAVTASQHEAAVSVGQSEAAVTAGQTEAAETATEDQQRLHDGESSTMDVDQDDTAVNDVLAAAPAVAEATEEEMDLADGEDFEPGSEQPDEDKEQQKAAETLPPVVDTMAGGYIPEGYTPDGQLNMPDYSDYRKEDERRRRSVSTGVFNMSRKDTSILLPPPPPKHSISFSLEQRMLREKNKKEVLERRAREAKRLADAQRQNEYSFTESEEDEDVLALQRRSQI